MNTSQNVKRTWKLAVTIRSMWWSLRVCVQGYNKTIVSFSTIYIFLNVTKRPCWKRIFVTHHKNILEINVTESPPLWIVFMLGTDLLMSPFTADGTDCITLILRAISLWAFIMDYQIYKRGVTYFWPTAEQISAYLSWKDTVKSKCTCWVSSLNVWNYLSSVRALMCSCHMWVHWVVIVTKELRWSTVLCQPSSIALFGATEFPFDVIFTHSFQ